MQTIRPKTAPLFFTNKHLPSSFYNLKWFVFLFRYLHAFFFWYKIYPWNHIAGWLEIKHKLPFDFLQRTKLFQFCPLGHKTLFVDKTSSSVSFENYLKDRTEPFLALISYILDEMSYSFSFCEMYLVYYWLCLVDINQQLFSNKII